MREYLFILIIAAVVTYLLTPLVRRGAIAVNAQHAPRARDVHTKPTPLLGGVAMYGGLVAGLLVAEPVLSVNTASNSCLYDSASRSEEAEASSLADTFPPWEVVN